jgi:hypothetical protein
LTQWAKTIEDLSTSIEEKSQRWMVLSEQIG